MQLGGSFEHQLLLNPAGTPATTAPNLDGAAQPIAYASRHYILACFVVFCIMQSAMWNFYSPINAPLEQVYGWTDDYIEWLGNAANITFCVLVVPIAAAIDLWGMRWSVLVTIVALCCNAGLRCIPLAWVGAGGFQTASMVSMIFNGIAGTVETLAPPVLSFLWFPVTERATATALMASANTLGTAAGFLTALVVPSTGSSAAILSALNAVYFVYASVCVATCVACVCYFPDRPPTPPSLSCDVPSVDVKSGLVKLLAHGRFWVVTASMAVPLGILSAFMNVLNINLQSYNLSQTDNGWIGFALALGGTLGGVVCGRVADAYPGRLSRILAALYLVASALVGLFMMILAGWVAYSLAAVVCLTAAIGFAFYGSYPLFFELSVETTFADGISSSATSGVLVMAQSAVTTAFLAVPVSSCGTAWMNWALLIAPAVFAIVLLSFREDYTRLGMDLKSAE